jgi:hypothetical protein
VTAQPLRIGRAQRPSERGDLDRENSEEEAAVAGIAERQFRPHKKHDPAESNDQTRCHPCAETLAITHERFDAGHPER